jgi:hypothetical protein
MTRRIAALLVLAVLLAAVPAAAVEEGWIGLPREGFSVRLPSGWTVEAPDPGSVLLVAKGEARLAVSEGRPAAGATQGDLRPWEVPGATGARIARTESQGATRVVGRVPRTGREDLVVEARAPSALVGELDAILKSFGATPFQNARVHADWRRGWTIEPPAGWRRAGEKPSTRFVSPDGSTVLSVDAWVDLPAPAEAPKDVDGWLRLGVEAALKERIGDAAIAEHDAPDVAEVGVGDGTDGKLAGFRVRTAAQKGTGEHGFAIVFATTKFRLMLLTAKEGSPASNEGFKSLRTFEANTLGVARSAGKESAGPTDRFARPDGPPVVFRRPQAWTSSEPRSSMRLAQFEIPGDPPAEVAVFWFGEGGGGGVEANLERWKGQMKSDAEPTRTSFEPADGIRVTLLDARGTYSAETMPGSGTRTEIADSRMLAAVIECPGGPIFVKGVGHRATMDAGSADFRAWLESFRPAN